ncbi:hypothetical protein JTB14_020350 [Gonioctena quinquepunctata]|nr:hypothetical protein JTB14_020350 [Gonioctena quinquepunctata]
MTSCRCRQSGNAFLSPVANKQHKNVPSEKRLDVSVKCVKICHLWNLANDCADISSDISVPISTEQDKTIENKYSDLLSSTYLTLEAKYLVTNEALQFLVNGLSDISEFNKEYVLKNIDQQVDISQIRNNQYSVIFEKIEILKSVTFMEGFSFALYFIFNLEFPSKIEATLEMVQRYHMKIHPASGEKSKETKNKVLNLMKKIDV